MPDTYCPLIFTQEAINKREDLVRCKGEKCAWWVVPPQEIEEPQGFCAIVQIAEELRAK